jgi:putative ABC transport system permease protein
LIVFVLWPYYNYTFRFDPEELLVSFVDRPTPASLAEMHRALALRIKADMAGNWRINQPIRVALQLALILLLLEITAVVALVLAAVGLYGVISYAVSQRTREIGIRMALGAGRGDVLGLAVRQSMAFTIAGIAAGLASAFALTRYLESMLFGLSPFDAPTVAGVSMVLAVVAALAIYVPACRATRVDPMVALRYE